MNKFIGAMAAAAVSGVVLMGCGPAAEDAAAPEEFAADVAAVWEAYLATVQALADDDETAARETAGEMQQALASADPEALDDTSAAVWEQEHEALGASLDRFLDGEDIEAVRAQLEDVSAHMREIVTAFHGGVIGPVYVVHCPMAFDDQGADWLDERDEVHNPYFGEMMYSCGSVTETLIEG